MKRLLAIALARFLRVQPEHEPLGNHAGRGRAEFAPGGRVADVQGAVRGDEHRPHVFTPCTELRQNRPGHPADLRRTLWPEVDVDLIRQHLEAFPKISAGDPAGGPIARLSLRERFHWLVSPRSTMIQVSPVHTGICDNPERSLDRLFARLTC